ncbi:MAG TPA: MotA/TolQ/ExbB proton channel family protein [Opitutaceae bacterium]|jgi:biopolymer transport protein ExbB/TolQ
MTVLRGFLERGGPVMAAIVVLSVVLYSRCLFVILALRAARRAQVSVGDRVASFRRERVFLGAMIAAAPLLGLLGTVRGMSTTFADLASVGGNSLQGLAGGISEVLIATESGLTVAIPALLLMHLAHREAQQP